MSGAEMAIIKKSIGWQSCTIEKTPVFRWVYTTMQGIWYIYPKRSFHGDWVKEASEWLTKRYEETRL
jgi:hypothetical protein